MSVSARAAVASAQVAGALGAAGDPVEDRRRRLVRAAPLEIDPEGAAVQEAAARLDDHRRVRVREQQRVVVADDVDREPGPLRRRGDGQRDRQPGRPRANAGRPGAAAPARGRSSRTALARPRARRTHPQAPARGQRRDRRVGAVDRAAEVVRDRERQLCVRGAAHKREYSSTISCSLTGALMSERTGSRSTLPSSASKSVCSQPLTTPVSSVLAEATSRTGPRIATDVPGLDEERRDVDLLAVHGHMAVVDELAGLGARAGEAEPVDDVVQAALEQLQQLLAGDALARAEAALM